MLPHGRWKQAVPEANSAHLACLLYGRWGDLRAILFPTEHLQLTGMNLDVHLLWTVLLRLGSSSY